VQFQNNSSAWTKPSNLIFYFLNGFVMKFNDEVYVFAGDNGSSYYKWLYKFNPATESFSFTGIRQTELTTDTYNETVTMGNNAYMFVRGNRERLYAFDRTSYSFALLSTYPGQALSGVVLFDGDSVLYAGGGYTSRDFWKYNPVRNTWTQLGNLPGETYWNNVFLVSGRSFVITSGNRFYEYLPASDSWIEKVPCPLPFKIGRAVVSLGGKVYVGFGGDLGTDGNPTDEMSCYDPATDTWTIVNNVVPSPRVRPLVFAWGNKLYFGGSYDYAFDFYSFDPSK